MKKQSVLSKSEQELVKNYLLEEFTITNALSSTLLTSIITFFILFMLNAVIFNAVPLIPQQPFSEFVKERVEYYAQQQSFNISEDESIISNLISSFILIFIHIILDALDYILFGVNKTSVYGTASLIFIVNIGFIFLIYLTVYRSQVKIKNLIISVIIGFIISCILLNLVAFIIIAFSLSPVLFGYIGWWVLLPSTTIAIPILVAWITGVHELWLVLWYVFVFILNIITSISVFISSKFGRKTLPETTVSKIEKIRERDDNYLWYIISLLVTTVVSILWKLLGRFVVEFFSIYPSPESNDEPILQHWIGGTPTNVLTSTGTFAVFFVLITIGYFVSFMTAYSIYRSAAGQKNWVELYKKRHPNSTEQFTRWFVYTTLLSLYWIYSIYIPRHLFLAEDWVQTFIWSAFITIISIVAGAATRIHYT